MGDPLERPDRAAKLLPFRGVARRLLQGLPGETRERGGHENLPLLPRRLEGPVSLRPPEQDLRLAVEIAPMPPRSRAQAGNCGPGHSPGRARVENHFFPGVGHDRIRHRRMGHRRVRGPRFRAEVEGDDLFASEPSRKPRARLLGFDRLQESKRDDGLEQRHRSQVAPGLLGDEHGIEQAPPTPTSGLGDPQAENPGFRQGRVEIWIEAARFRSAHPAGSRFFLEEPREGRPQQFFLFRKSKSHWFPRVREGYCAPRPFGGGSCAQPRSGEGSPTSACAGFQPAASRTGRRIRPIASTVRTPL